jgi:hypothetical protein
MGLDTNIYWLTDRQSQCDFDFDFNSSEFSVGDSLKKQNRGVSSRREFWSVKVLFEVCYEDYEGMEYWRVRL